MPRSIDFATIKRLVVRAPNWLGDAVLALPAIAALREALPDSTLAIAAIPSVAPLFAERIDAEPDEVLTIDESASEPRLLAAGQFDAIVLLPNSFRSAWTARRARIPRRWGYGGGPAQSKPSRARRSCRKW